MLSVRLKDLNRQSVWEECTSTLKRLELEEERNQLHPQAFRVSRVLARLVPVYNRLIDKSSVHHPSFS